MVGGYFVEPLAIGDDAFKIMGKVRMEFYAHFASESFHQPQPMPGVQDKCNFQDAFRKIERTQNAVGLPDKIIVNAFLDFVIQ